MQVGVMITNGGPHPPDKWAEMTANQIVQVSPTADSPMAIAARALEAKIKDALEGHHARVQTIERDLLDKDEERLAAMIDPSRHLDIAVKAVVDAANGTMWQTHFAEPQIQEYVKRLLAQHFATVMDIERDWFARRHPHKAICKAYRTARDAHGAAHVHATINRYRPAKSEPVRRQSGA